MNLGGSATSVRAVNAQTGAFLWDSTLPPVGGIYPITVDSRDQIYVTTTQGYLFVLAPTNGQILVQSRIADSFLSGVSIGLNGRGYAVGTRFGKTYVYSIR
jgi:outer membrane protein assembly factor BamB